MTTRRAARALSSVLASAAVAATAAASVSAHAASRPPAKHVLLVSVDGLHQSDLVRYVATHPHSAMAALVAHGTEFTHASTTFPSDSFPGMIAQLTGASPGVTGVYYDDTYNPRLLPPGTRDCATAARGSEVSWTEGADRALTLDAGQQLAAPALTNIPTNTKAQTLAAAPAITRAVLSMTPTPQALLDPDALPVDPASCVPVYPHQSLPVNTVFDVARQHGMRTAWSDKHPAYEILAGRSGASIQDLFTPEINGVADSTGDDWTTDNLLTREYDGFKVAAVLNEIDGYDHSGTRHVGTPAIFGMNFQAVSTAQKLPGGGYAADGTPSPLLVQALDFVDAQLAAMRARIRHDGLAGSTTIILSAKHGQSPIDPSLLRRVDDGAIVDAINAGWAGSHPGTAPLVAFDVADDVLLMWLSNRGPAALAYVRAYLLAHRAPANTINDPAGTFSTSVPHSGLTRVYTGASADRLFGATSGSVRTPDVVGVTQVGVVYTAKTKKISEHGGDAVADRHVPLIVAGAGVPHGFVTGVAVQTTAIAPGILLLLGLDPRQLDAVRVAGAHTAPSLIRR